MSVPEDSLPVHLTPGLPLREITLPATDGSEVCLATLAGLSVVAVYPWTGSPDHPNPPGWDDIPGAHGSTPELEGFRDLFGSLSQTGTRLYGLSGQTTAYQREMALRLELPFPILSDEEGAFARALHLPTFEAGSQSYLKRLTFAVMDGQIEHVFFPVTEPGRHAQDVLDWLLARAG